MQRRSRDKHQLIDVLESLLSGRGERCIARSNFIARSKFRPKTRCTCDDARREIRSCGCVTRCLPSSAACLDNPSLLAKAEGRATRFYFHILHMHSNVQKRKIDRVSFACLRDRLVEDVFHQPIRTFQFRVFEVFGELVVDRIVVDRRGMSPARKNECWQ